MAVEQFAGKGQLGATWKSTAGLNLTFSILLFPTQIPAAKQFRLTQTLSVAIALALEEVLGEDQVQIKWPNDLYVNGKKLVGMLIENTLHAAGWKAAIAGFGINVNQPSFEGDLQYKATSILIQSGQKRELIPLLRDICASMDLYYKKFLNQDLEQIFSLYTQKLYLRGCPHVFKIDGIPVEGKIVGTTDQGLLTVDFNGHLANFNAKEISY